jgi:hypothetical protein
MRDTVGAVVTKIKSMAYRSIAGGMWYRNCVRGILGRHLRNLYSVRSQVGGLLGGGVLRMQEHANHNQEHEKCLHPHLLSTQNQHPMALTPRIGLLHGLLSASPSHSARLDYLITPAGLLLAASCSAWERLRATGRGLLPVTRPWAGPARAWGGTGGAGGNRVGTRRRCKGRLIFLYSLLKVTY